MNTKKLVNLIKIACSNKIIHILAVSSIGILMALPSTALKSTELCESSANKNKSSNYRKSDQDLLKTLEEEGRFNSLTNEDIKAKLTRLIKERKYILLAPNDEAFRTISDEDFAKYFDFDSSESELERLLKYHLIDPETPEYIQQDGTTGKIETVEGSTILFSRQNGELNIDIADVKQPCLEATNGLIIEIDRVLIPPELKS